MEYHEFSTRSAFALDISLSGIDIDPYKNRIDSKSLSEILQDIYLISFWNHIGSSSLIHYFEANQ
jgi:uncharacterized protein YfaA (DUF2138 family)